MSKGLEVLEIIKHTTDLDRPNELNGYHNEIYNIEKELKALEIIKELMKIRIGIDESENCKSCGTVLLVGSKDIWVVYQTFDEENIQKLKSLKEVLL